MILGSWDMDTVLECMESIQSDLHSRYKLRVNKWVDCLLHTVARVDLCTSVDSGNGDERGAVERMIKGLGFDGVARAALG